MWFDLLSGEGGDPATARITSHLKAKVDSPDTRLIDVSLDPGPYFYGDKALYVINFLVTAARDGWRIDDIQSPTGGWALGQRLFWNELTALKPKVTRPIP